MMKKITFILTMIFSLVLTNTFAQGSCATAVPLTPGTQQCGDTSSGADVYDNNSCLGSYDGGDDYIFSYVATATGETLTLDLTGVAAWTGFAMSDDCPDVVHNCYGSATTTAGGNINFTSSPLTSGVTYYIHISTWPSPQSTAFCLDAVVNAAPTCIDPDTFVASNITTTSVDLSWNDPSGTQFDFEYVIQPQGTGMPAGAGTPISDFTVTDNTLSAATAYEAWVRADCGGGDYSAWVGPISFTTACSAFVAPYNEPFAVNSLPTCWTQGGATAWEFGSSATTPVGFAGWGAAAVPDFNGAGGTFIGMDGSDNTDGEVSTLTSPFIDVSSLTTPRLKYAVFSNNTNDTAQNLLEVEVWDGAAWNLVNTVQSNLGANWVVYTTDLTTLTITGNVQVRYTVTGFANGGSTFYNDILIDDVTIEETPSTPPACATNVVGTPNASCGNFDNVLSWDAVSGADGYYLTVGTSTGGNDVLDNQDMGAGITYTFAGAANTTYYFTVVPYNANGPATGCSEVSFTTAATGCYCDSVPTSNDGNGITNVQIATTDFPTGDVTYFDHTATVVDLAQGLNANVQVTFETGYTYDTNIWIDFNDDFIFDSSELVFQGVSLATNPTTLDASFVMPAAAPLGQHRMRIGTADTGQAIPNPCYSGTWGVTLDFTVNVIAATCSPAAVANSTIVPDCANSQFSVDVDVTALGDGTPVITDGTSNWPVVATGIVTVGPFADGSSVSLTILHGSDATCDLPLGNFSNTCPAANDDLCNAIPLVVNAISTGTQYNNIGATAEVNEPVATCFSNGIYGSVWFSFVAPASGEVIISTDIAGATLTDTEIALYDSTGVNCSDLSTLGAALACDQDGGTIVNFNSVINQAGLNPGTTYFIQVDVWNAAANGNFGIEVQEVLSSDSFDNNNFMAYPNPVKDILNLSYTSEITNVRVVNMLGQEVISRNLNVTTAQVDMSQLSAGTYIVNVTIGDVVKTLKVVKQ